MSLQWSNEIPLLLSLWRFASILHGKDALDLLHRTAIILSRRPESSDRFQAFTFFTRKIRRGTPPLAILEKSAPLPNSLQPLRSLPEPERSLLCLSLCSDFPLAKISSALGIHQLDAAKLLDESLQKILAIIPSPDANPTIPPLSPVDNSSPPPNASLNSTPISKIQFLRSEINSLQPNSHQLDSLKEIALLLERRSASWIPSLRDPAFLGFLAACLLFLAIAWWLLSQSSRSLEGEQKLKSLLENATQAEATEYEPVSTSLDQIDDWLALQGLDDFWLPNSLLDSKALAVRTFPFEGSRVAAVLLPEQQMILCFFDPTPLDISFPNENVWNYFQSGNNTAAVAIRGRLCILAAIRGTRAQLQNILQPDKPNS